MQLTPARGRIRRFLHTPDAVPRCNLPPHGDGYRKDPAVNRNSGDATYPRMGTDTQMESIAFSFKQDATYPRMGTDTIISFVLTITAPDATYPRMGTDTC